MRAYENMASLYDRLMKDAPYEQWALFTKQVFQKLNKEVNTIADLGCGTGEVTIRLANEGYQMLGVDYSSDMLTWAEQKSSQNKLPIQWMHQDVRELTGIGKLDAVISYCDVINYIVLEEDIKEVLSRVYQTLKDDGVFIFDIHAMDYVENLLVGHSFTDVSDEVAYIWDCFAGDEDGEMFHELTFFTKTGENQYARFDETHHQRTYPTSFYKKLLEEIGFENIILCSDFDLKNQNTDQQTERIFIIAEKGRT